MADIKVTLADIRAVGKSAATLYAVRRLVHRLFAVAVEEDRVPRNPVSGVETEKVEPREPRFLTQEEVRANCGGGFRTHTGRSCSFSASPACESVRHRRSGSRTSI
jgi:hypothetical protein